MQYVERQYLTVVELENGRNTIAFHELKQIILEKPSDTIYCEKTGILYGIITMGDILRASDAGAAEVTVNTRFTSVSSVEYMKARKIFRDNERIHAVPIVNTENALAGAYSRWDDLLNIRYMMSGKNAGGGVKRDWHNRIALVRPCQLFKEKQQLFQESYNFLEKRTEVARIGYEEIVDFVDEVEWIVFIDEDEFRAMDTLYAKILHGYFKREKCITLKKFIELIEYRNAATYFKIMKDKGIHIIDLKLKNTNYKGRLSHDILNRFAAHGEKVSSKLPPSLYKYFFDDLYTEEYAKNISHMNCAIENKSGCGKLKDCATEYYQVTDGERQTLEQPETYDRAIWFIGPCFIYGRYVEDKNTIESFLQRRLNEAHYHVKVVNCGSPAYSNNWMLEMARMMTLPLKKGDVIVIYVNEISLPEITELNLVDVLGKYDISANWFVDSVAHCNHRVNGLFAEAIYDKLQPMLSDAVDGRGELIESNTDFIKELYIDRYFYGFDSLKYKKIGSIVMNCNPFTNGHRYLIEQALQKSDFLIIFVVEEDRSEFTFAERYSMVCDGVADLDHVMAVPSGPFILAQTTFPEYFIKAADEELVQNAENDITIFAEKIAPCLHITHRFVGEEPEDNVTKEYNMAMKKILPKNDIELIEIPRKELERKYISASSARVCLEKNDMDGFRKLVPESTVRILFKNET